MRNFVMTKESKVIRGAFNDVVHHRLYFGGIAGTSIIRAGEKRLWANGVGQTEKNISTGADVTLTECDTSLTGENGIIPNGEAFVISAIGVHFEISNTQATTPFTNDAVQSIDVTPVAQASPVPLQQALKSQCTFELWRNADERLERGNIDEYPCQFGSQGFAGSESAAGDVNTMVGTNGMVFRALTVYHELKALDQFYGVLKVCREIDLSATLLTGHIDFYLVGRAMTDYQADQFVRQY